MISIEDRDIDFQDTGGDGPVVLFVPGSFSTPAAWRPLQKSLPPEYRYVSTSLLGYGETDETRSTTDFDMSHETRVIGAVAAEIGKPVHLVGHSFGGTVALAAALAGVIDVLSIATFEANPLDLLRSAGRDGLSADTRRMSDAYAAAFASGEADAPKRIIDFWGVTVPTIPFPTRCGSIAAGPRVPTCWTGIRVSVSTLRRRPMPGWMCRCCWCVAHAPTM